MALGDSIFYLLKGEYSCKARNSQNLGSQLQCLKWGSPKMGVPIRKTMAYRGLHWIPPILGNNQILTC